MKVYLKMIGKKTYIGISGLSSVDGEGSWSIVGSRGVIGKGHSDEGSEKSNLVTKKQKSKMF